MQAASSPTDILSIWFHYERRFISLQPYYHRLMAWKKRHTHTLPLEDKMKQYICLQSFCFPICFPSHHSGSGKRQRGIIYAFVDLWLVLIHNAVIFKGKSSKHHRPGLDGQFLMDNVLILQCLSIIYQSIHPLLLDKHHLNYLHLYTHLSIYQSINPIVQIKHQSLI